MTTCDTKNRVIVASIKTYDLDDDIHFYIERLENLMLKKVSEDVEKKSFFMNSTCSNTYKFLKSLAVDEAISTRTFTQLVTHLKSHSKPQVQVSLTLDTKFNRILSYLKLFHFSDVTIKVSI